MAVLSLIQSDYIIMIYLNNLLRRLRYEKKSQKNQFGLIMSMYCNTANSSIHDVDDQLIRMHDSITQ